MPDFLDIDKIEREELLEILDLAVDIKSKLKAGEVYKPLQDKQLAMIFEKPSTRTRVSFEVGINQLGGNPIVLNNPDSKLGERESIYDTAKVLSRYVDLIMVRCFSHKSLLELAKYSDVPVINGLTDASHPCQIMADILTFIEHKGAIENKTIAWIGDGNNMANSWIHAAKQLNFKLNIATPEELKPTINFEHENISWYKDPKKAVKNADLVTTDTWVSMGDKDYDRRHGLLKSYQVDKNLMSCAHKDAIFMHCLPAHREEEVTAEVIDGRQSVVFDEAENRLHIQKAIIIWSLKK